MRVDVLGPVVVRDGDDVIAVGGPRQRAVLAVLGLLGGSVVSTGALAEAVWAGSPPRTADHTLHNYVLRLRRLGLDIARVGDGYRLNTTTDAAVVEHALTEDDGIAAALSLVRGNPDQELGDTDLTRARCAELVETIEALREHAAAAGLDAADTPKAAAQIVPELRRLVTAEPYRERRWELLMLALYRAGRQSEALEAFATARTRLATDLGIEPSPALRRMQQAVLAQDPALGTTANPAGRSAPLTGGGRALPGLATRLIGRAAELDAVEGALAASRLVTIVGPLGAGKTRVALEIARRQTRPVWFVALEGLAAPTTVGECALAVVAPTSRAADATVGLAEALAASDGLLVLDGAEACVDAIRDLTATLLAAAPQVRLLVTSRQSLRAHDEAAVPLVALDQADRRTLLADRARLVDPTFALADADIATADRLCALVDGLPLGIELVARHLRLLTVGELAARVDADLDRWTSGAGDEDGGLIGAVAASVHELREDVRRLLLSLAVLPAEADVDLVHDVATPDAAEDWVFDALASLVDRSLVQVRSGPTGIRYGLLLSVRRCCLGLLDEADRHIIESRYVRAVLRRAVRLAPELKSAQRSAVLARLDADEPHLRAALAASLDGGDANEGLRAATALADYWLARRPGEGLGWLQRLLAAADIDGADRASVLLQMGHFAYWLTEFSLGTRLLTEARQLLSNGDSLATDDPVLLGRVLRRMGAIAAASDEVDRARLLLQESVMVLQTGGDDVEEAMSLLHLGSLLADESHVDEALPLLIRARDALAAAGDPLQEGHALAALNLAWWKSGDLLAARGAGERALARFRELGHRPSEGVVAYRLASIARSLGDAVAAADLAEASLAAGRDSGTRTTIALAQLARARLALDASDGDAAAVDIGAALELLDVATDRWVLAEATEAAARLQHVRQLPAVVLFDRAAELREVIGQPAPPSDAAELERLRAAAPDHASAVSAPPVSNPAALREWLLDVCAASAPIRVGSVDFGSVGRLER